MDSIFFVLWFLGSRPRDDSHAHKSLMACVLSGTISDVASSGSRSK